MLVDVVVFGGMMVGAGVRVGVGDVAVAGPGGDGFVKTCEG